MDTKWKHFFSAPIGNKSSTSYILGSSSVIFPSNSCLNVCGEFVNCLKKKMTADKEKNNAPLVQTVLRGSDCCRGLSCNFTVVQRGVMPEFPHKTSFLCSVLPFPLIDPHEIYFAIQARDCCSQRRMCPKQKNWSLGKICLFAVAHRYVVSVICTCISGARAAFTILAACQLHAYSLSPTHLPLQFSFSFL